MSAAPLSSHDVMQTYGSFVRLNIVRVYMRSVEHCAVGLRRCPQQRQTAGSKWLRKLKQTGTIYRGTSARVPWRRHLLRTCAQCTKGPVVEVCDAADPLACHAACPSNDQGGRRLTTPRAGCPRPYVSVPPLSVTPMSGERRTHILSTCGACRVPSSCLFIQVCGKPANDG